MPQNRFHVMVVPALHPLLTEGNRIEIHAAHCSADNSSGRSIYTTGKTITGS
jgi:hypothetical protein